MEGLAVPRLQRCLCRHQPFCHNDGVIGDCGSLLCQAAGQEVPNRIVTRGRFVDNTRNVCTGRLDWPPIPGPGMHGIRCQGKATAKGETSMARRYLTRAEGIAGMPQNRSPGRRHAAPTFPRAPLRFRNGVSFEDHRGFFLLRWRPQMRDRASAPAPGRAAPPVHRRS